MISVLNPVTSCANDDRFDRLNRTSHLSCNTGDGGRHSILYGRAWKPAAWSRPRGTSIANIESRKHDRGVHVYRYDNITCVIHAYPCDLSRRSLWAEKLFLIRCFSVLDSLSVANDIERVFSRPGGNVFRQFNHHRLQSTAHHEQKSSKGEWRILTTNKRKKNPWKLTIIFIVIYSLPLLRSDQFRYEQLSRLHELYNGKVGVPKHVPNNFNHSTLPSRVQSASLSDVFKNDSTDSPSTNHDQIHPSNDFDNNSIASEPAYLLVSTVLSSDVRKTSVSGKLFFF